MVLHVTSFILVLNEHNVFIFLQLLEVARFFCMLQVSLIAEISARIIKLLTVSKFLLLVGI